MRKLKPEQRIVLYTHMTHRAHISHLWLPFLYLTWNEINWVKKTLEAHLCFLKRFNTVLWAKTEGNHFRIAPKLLVIKIELCVCVCVCMHVIAVHMYVWSGDGERDIFWDTATARASVDMLIASHWSVTQKNADIESVTTTKKSLEHVKISLISQIKACIKSQGLYLE